MTDTLRYTYRLRPGKQAEERLLAEWGLCRWLWNEAVHQQRSQQKPTRAKLDKLLTEARGRIPWLREGSQNVQASTLGAYAKALDHSFKVKGSGRPKFKRAEVAKPTLPYTRNGFSLVGGRLVLAKCPPIPVVWHRGLPSEPTSVRVYQDSLGHWYASFVVRREITPVPVAGGSIGIDWGVRTTATTTDPTYDLPYSGHRKRCAAELAKAQRKMARRHRKGSPATNGYKTAKRQAARVHKKAARQAKHEARTWAQRVVADHQVIAIEDFKPKFLARSTMARKAADAAIAMTKAELLEQARRANRTVVLMPPAYTTMTCAGCGTRAKARIGLGVRTFSCTACGTTACRDRNAARTILVQAERYLAGADDVRHSTDLLSAVGGVRSEPESPRLRPGGVFTAAPCDRQLHTTMHLVPA